MPRIDGSSLYAQDEGESLWVQIMEKAYVQSGLRVKGGLEKAEAGTLLSSYDDIESGHEWDAVSHIIGNAQGISADTYRFLDTPPASDKNGYSQKELDFVNELKTALADGQLLNAAFAGKRTGFFGTSLDEKHKTVSGIGAQESGMYTLHAYSVHAVEEEDGKYYITVRNPHGHSGINTLSDGTLISASTEMAAGYSRLELRDFGAYFNYVSISSVDITAAGAERMAESKNIVRHYGEAVRRIAEALKSSDKALMFFKNSKKFREFRDAADSLNKIMQSDAPTEKKLNDGLEKLFEKAKAYSDQCENEKKISPFKDSHRSFIRYQAAKIAAELKTVYDANKGRTLRDKWDEFSWSAAAKKADVPTTPDDLHGIYRAAADGMARRLDAREGDFANAETRNKLYTFLKDFAEDGSADKLNKELSSLKTESERFNCLRSNSRTVCTMHFINDHADEILRAMESDGFSM